MTKALTTKANAVGVAISATVVAYATIFSAKIANAQTLGADDFFGSTAGEGANVDGASFASSAGLSAGDLITTIESVLRTALGFLGIIAVIMILLGGFKWMTAAGNDEKVKDAKKLIYSGIIGLVIILTAYAIASFVIQTIVTAQNPAA